MALKEPKQNKRTRMAQLIDAMGGGLCPDHGEYLGFGKYDLRACPFCDIDEHFKQIKEAKFRTLGIVRKNKNIKVIYHHQEHMRRQ